CITTLLSALHTLSLHDALPISIRRGSGPGTGCVLAAPRRRGNLVLSAAQAGSPRARWAPGAGAPRPPTAARCRPTRRAGSAAGRSEEHTSELQSLAYLVCRLLL